MKVIDVYQQFFAARCIFSGVERRAVTVTLTATSDAGTVRYEACVSFFPHREEDDFAVSYDAFASQELYAGPGRRSKKREKILLEESLRPAADALAASMDGEVFWDRPLREARLS